MSDTTAQRVEPAAAELLGAGTTIITEGDIEGTPLEWFDQGGEHDGEHVETPTVKRGTP